MPRTWEINMPDYQNNCLVHIYVTHVHRVITTNAAKGDHRTTDRSKIERDIIHLIHKENFPLDYKIACTCMILNTDAFDVFWIGLKYQYHLDDDCIERLEPDWDLVRAVPPPSSPSSPSPSLDAAMNEPLPAVVVSPPTPEGSPEEMHPTTGGKKLPARKQTRGRKPKAPATKAPRKKPQGPKRAAPVKRSPAKRGPAKKAHEQK